MTWTKRLLALLVCFAVVAAACGSSDDDPGDAVDDHDDASDVAGAGEDDGEPEEEPTDEDDGEPEEQPADEDEPEGVTPDEAKSAFQSAQDDTVVRCVEAFGGLTHGFDVFERIGLESHAHVAHYVLDVC
ncbi:MAG: hypothetical protein AAGC53_19835, partial [Actinomycetota bacterium]